MNPLDMMGPAFLAFYAFYGIVGFVLVTLVKERLNDSAPPGRWIPGQYPRDQEVYHLALLRGGASQVSQTLLGRLVSAGFAAIEGDTITPASQPAGALERLLPIERKALAALPAPPRAATDAVIRPLYPELAVMRNELAADGLVPSREQIAAFRRLLLTTLVAIPGLGVLKLLVALARGRSNVLFLILMILGYVALTALLLRVPDRTRAGDRYLAWLQDSHRPLLDDVKSGHRAGAMDLALAAGIFGIAVLPQMEPLDRAMRPPLTTGSGSSCSSGGCGSGGDSGGDGGGGDGGGGGCGGCGGGGD